MSTPTRLTLWSLSVLERSIYHLHVLATAVAGTLWWASFLKPTVPLVPSCRCKSSDYLEQPIASFLPLLSTVSRDWPFIFSLHSGCPRENYMSWAQGLSTTVFRPLSTCLAFLCLLVYDVPKWQLPPVTLSIFSFQKSLMYHCLLKPDFRGRL